MALHKNIYGLNEGIFTPFSNLHGIFQSPGKPEKALRRNTFPSYAASFMRSLTMLVILATNSPLVGLPFSGLTVLPK